MTMDMRDMVKALAVMLEGQRKTMMDERLKMFAGISDADRAKAVQQMMKAAGTLPDGDIGKLIKGGTPSCFTGERGSTRRSGGAASSIRAKSGISRHASA